MPSTRHGRHGRSESGRCTWGHAAGIRPTDGRGLLGRPREMAVTTRGRNVSNSEKEGNENDSQQVRGGRSEGNRHDAIQDFEWAERRVGYQGERWTMKR